jgi:peroxiredoxin
MSPRYTYLHVSKKNHFFIFLSVLLAFWGLVLADSMAEIRIGEKAPAFQAPGDDGKTYNLSDLKGKWVVLEWFNPDCPFVKKHYHPEFRNMQNLQKRAIEKAATQGGLVWLAVNSSAPGKQGHLSAQEALKVRSGDLKASMTAIVLDHDGKMGRAYGAKTTPHLYLISPQGILLYQGAIDDKPTADVADIKGARNYLEQALDEALVGKAVGQAQTKQYGCSVKY